MNDTLEITTLGGLDVRIGGEPVTGFYSRKVEALLVYLACSGRVQPRDVLADLLWDEVTQSRAMGSLRVVLHYLREKLGPYVEVTRATVALNVGNSPSTGSGQASTSSAQRPRAGPAVWLDVAELEDGLATSAEPGGLTSPAAAEEVADALNLYQGDFLAGFYVRDCPRFEEWQLVEQERLRNLVVGALKTLVAYYREQGGYDSALLHARRLLELDPLLEEAQRQVMVCLASSGQRSAALAQYEACRRILEAELGVEPEVETTALYQRIVTGEIAVTTAVTAPPRHNLPPQQTPFVGREAELADLGRLLSDPNVRLVTVVGPGGMGKTRLALEAAAGQLERYEHGVHFVAMAPLSSADGIVPAVADAVGFTFYEGGEPRQQLLDYLHGKQMLLVMDNYEHLLSPPARRASPPEGGNEEEAALVSEILRAAPRVRVLVTSRVRLNMLEEQLFQLGGMDFPDWETPEDAMGYSGVALFVQGAQRVRRDFKVRGDDLAYLTRICSQVGGMPLAILLAAGWVDTLAPEEITEQIGRSLDLLETELRNVPERQRSIRAAIDHSWKLLTAREREVMRTLSVFRGGFTWEAAQSIVGASLHELRGLVDRSLVQRTSTRRYDVHELLRQYAEEKLDVLPDGGAAARDTHCGHYAVALEQWAEDLRGARQIGALAEMRLDHANIRAAWEWAVREGRAARLDEMAEGLARYYDRLGLFQEGEDRFGLAADRLATVSTVEGQRVRAATLIWQAFLRTFSGRRDAEAVQLARHGLTLLEQPALADADTRAERALALCVIGLSSDASIDWDETVCLLEQSLSLFRALDDRYMAANLVGWLGVRAEISGDYDEARERREESLALRRALGDNMGIAASLSSLGFIALMQGQLEQGERQIREGSRLLQQLNTRMGLASGYHIPAVAHYYQGRFAKARALALESVAIIDELGFRVHQKYFEASLLLGFVDLSLGRYEAAHAQGQLLTAAGVEGNRLFAGLGQVLAAAAAVAGARFGEARERLHESIVARTEAFLWPVLGSPGRGQESALLGYAARGLGKGGQAWRHVREALSAAAERHLFLPLITALPALALLLIDAGDAERAVELYALASRYGHVASSQWFEDVAGKEIAAVAATLPPDVVASAQEQGRARDLWETAEELLAELTEK